MSGSPRFFSTAHRQANFHHSLGKHHRAAQAVGCTPRCLSNTQASSAPLRSSNRSRDLHKGFLCVVRSLGELCRDDVPRRKRGYSTSSRAAATRNQAKKHIRKTFRLQLGNRRSHLEIRRQERVIAPTAVLPKKYKVIAPAPCYLSWLQGS